MLVLALLVSAATLGSPEKHAHDVAPLNELAEWLADANLAWLGDRPVVLEVASELAQPVLFVEVWAFAPGSKGWDTSAAVAKTALLDDGLRSMREDGAAGLSRARARRRSGRWSLRYELELGLLPAERADRYLVEWRVEYSSLEESLEHFTRLSRLSFVGRPARRGWFRAGLPSPSPLRSFWVIQNLRAPSPSWLRTGELGERELGTTEPGADRCRGLGLGSGFDAHLTVVGDSQPAYACEELQAAVSTRASVTCVQHKGVPTVAQTIAQVDLTNPKNATLPNLLESIKAKSARGVLAINFSGLWAAAYGEYEEDLRVLKILLEAVCESRYRFVALMTTTTVHPILYEGLREDHRKWGMTATRVRSRNSALRRAFAASACFNSGAVGLVDMESLSLARGDDPRSSSDMRHFGAATNRLLMEYLLCALAEKLTAVGG